MEQAYFIYENYHYLVALYGYYKVISTGYDNYEKGKRLYRFCNGTYKWFFPDKITNGWEEVKINNVDEIKIEENKDWIEVIPIKRLRRTNSEPKLNVDKQVYQRGSLTPSYKPRTSDCLKEDVFRLDSI